MNLLSVAAFKLSTRQRADGNSEDNGLYLYVLQILWSDFLSDLKLWILISSTASPLIFSPLEMCHVWGSDVFAASCKWETDVDDGILHSKQVIPAGKFFSKFSIIFNIRNTWQKIFHLEIVSDHPSSLSRWPQECSLFPFILKWASWYSKPTICPQCPLWPLAHVQHPSETAFVTLTETWQSQ